MYFLKMIETLRREESVLLFANVQSFTDAESLAVTDFLRGEYNLEMQEYPFEAPEFHAPAALWAAKQVYIAAQLILYRKNPPKDLPALFPDFDETPDASAFLSADLTLRFVPDMLFQLQLIDPDDPLNAILSTILDKWHFSGAGKRPVPPNADFEVIRHNSCIFQLYRDRITAARDLSAALHPELHTSIRADLGLYAPAFWTSFSTVNII